MYQNNRGLCWSFPAVPAAVMPIAWMVGLALLLLWVVFMLRATA